MMSFEEEYLHRYPCLVAHLICEKDIYQLSPAEAALILRDAKYGFRCEHEWVDYRFEGDARRAVRRAVRNRHRHSREDYNVAQALIELTLGGAM